MFKVTSVFIICLFLLGSNECDVVNERFEIPKKAGELKQHHLHLVLDTTRTFPDGYRAEYLVYRASKYIAQAEGSSAELADAFEKLAVQILKELTGWKFRRKDFDSGMILFIGPQGHCLLIKPDTSVWRGRLPLSYGAEDAEIPDPGVDDNLYKHFFRLNPDFVHPMFDQKS